MPDMRNTDSDIFFWVVDFLILSVTFFISWMLLSIEPKAELLVIHLVGYSTILLASILICKRIAVGNMKSIGEASRQILANGAGILIGTCVMLLLELKFSANDQILVAVIFSSLMAFFVLGTLSPIVGKTPIVHKRSSSF